MNYIYDILLNFNPIFYNFYDWYKKDKIEHIKKIPLFKVDDQTIKDFMNYELIIEENFLVKIKNKTEIFINRKVKQKEYTFLITNLKKSLAIDLKNEKILISDLLIDEDELVKERASNLPECKILYKKLKKQAKEKLKTRKSIETEIKLKDEINKIYTEKDVEKLEYIYYECFNKKEKNIDKIYKKLIKEIEENLCKIEKTLLPLLKLTKNIV